MKHTVFQRIMEPIAEGLMEECKRRFRSDYDCEKFTTEVHLKTMVYAQITEMKSLRTLEEAVNSQKIGMKTKITRSTLSDANNRRPAACFLWILERVMSLLPRKFRKDLNKLIKVLDSSLIQLKGKGYDEWAKASASPRCQGLKIHTEYDLVLGGPTQFAISAPNYNDSSMGQRWPIQANTIYIFDKGYCDFNWWWSIDEKQAFFVTRLKKNTAILMETNHKNSSGLILEDGLFRFKNKKPRGGKINLYQKPLRRISVLREDKEPLILVTNLQHVSAEIVAELYKARWQIELFFKWVKQNLKVKKFLGKSANAVKIQLATALIAYVLLQIFKNVSGDPRTLQLLLVWVRYNLTIVDKQQSYYAPPIYQFSQLSFINREAA